MDEIAKPGKYVETLQAENAKLKARLWKIVTAFKRGTPASHIFCECKKCTALYEAVREVQMYEMPDQNSEII